MSDDKATIPCAVCPTCGKAIPLSPMYDGCNRRIPGKYRMGMHAGKLWGRICKDEGGVFERKEEE